MRPPALAAEASPPHRNAAGNPLTDAQACLARGDRQQALAIMTAAVAAAPHDPALLTGLGVALTFAGQAAAAADAYEQALAFDPARADAQVYLGMLRLAQGRQKEGWQLYRARWRVASWTEPLRYPAGALWDGRISGGLRVLLWGEQGFGDMIQFARFAPWIAQLLRSQGASTALEVPAPLHRLFAQSWPFLEVSVRGRTRGRFDAHLPLMDLPLLWGGQVGPAGMPYLPSPSPYLSVPPAVETLPRGVAPNLTAPDVPTPDIAAPDFATPDVTAPDVTTSCRARPRRRPPRVGIAWQGRPSHHDDLRRSIRPTQLEPLFAVPGICWISLQKDAAEHPAWLPQDLASCQDFLDTARIVATLDLVVSIDSAVAHLAAALGRPVWLLVPAVADWRWGSAGEDTPWYPTMRLFRQRPGKDWPTVLQQVAQALASFGEAPGAEESGGGTPA